MLWLNCCTWYVDMKTTKINLIRHQIFRISKHQNLRLIFKKKKNNNKKPIASNEIFPQNEHSLTLSVLKQLRQFTQSSYLYELKLFLALWNQAFSHTRTHLARCHIDHEERIFDFLFFFSLVLHNPDILIDKTKIFCRNLLSEFAVKMLVENDESDNFNVFHCANKQYRTNRKEKKTSKTFNFDAFVYIWRVYVRSIERMIRA